MVDAILLLRKVELLEQHFKEVQTDNAQLKIENARQAATIKQLESTLQQYAAGKLSKEPKFGLNYSSERNEPPDTKKKDKKKKDRKRPGRKPKSQKPDQAHCIVNIYPDGVCPNQCVFVREQFVWRLLDHKAQYVYYKIFDLPDSQTPPTIPGARTARSEYGIEFFLILAHHVYWIGLSIDKALTLMEFYTEINIPKSQADTMLYQLANDWESEYKEIAEPERKLILLQRELVEKLDCLFVFVSDPTVGSTNNQSERDLREEAQARKAGRSSKTEKGAKRRSTILSIFGTMKRRMEQCSLENLLKVVCNAYEKNISLFNRLPPKNQKRLT